MKDYQAQALQTLQEGQSPYDNAQHAGYGLMTEVGEILDTYKRHRFYKTPLDTKNLIEEVGDVLWYVSLGYHSLGLPLPAVPTEVRVEVDLVLTPIQELPLNKVLAKIAHHVGNFFSIVMMYDDTWLDEQLDYDLDKIYKYLDIYLRNELNSTLEIAAAANIEKLSKRYPEKMFSTDRALNRDTVHELSHINPIEEGVTNEIPTA